MDDSQNNPPVTFTSGGTSLPLWGVRAGMLIVSTRYEHDAQSLVCDVVDKRDDLCEIARRLRDMANADRDQAEETEQTADAIAAILTAEISLD